MRQYTDGEYLVTEHDNGTVVRELDNQPLTLINATKQWTKKEFVKLFTPSEWSAAKALAATDQIAEQLMDLILISEFIRSDDPDVSGGLDYFTATGVLAAGRKEQILS